LQAGPFLTAILGIVALLVGKRLDDQIGFPRESTRKRSWTVVRVRPAWCSTWRMRG
jgi:hypothetical protein